MYNPHGIHTREGYDFWAEQVIALDRLNPEIAARLARAFDNWARFAQPNRAAMEQALLHIQAQASLSSNVTEIITKALRSEEHTSELQSLMRISYAVFCLKKKNTNQIKK